MIPEPDSLRAFRPTPTAAQARARLAAELRRMGELTGRTPDQIARAIRTANHAADQERTRHAR